MKNVSFKAFMWDLREEGLFYAIKTTVWWLNPYAQLREAHAWLDTYREVIEDLAVPTGEYESRYGKSIMLDEWRDSDTREQVMQAAKLLNPLLDAKTPRKNNKRT